MFPPNPRASLVSSGIPSLIHNCCYPPSKSNQTNLLLYLSASLSSWILRSLPFIYFRYFLKISSLLGQLLLIDFKGFITSKMWLWVKRYVCFFKNRNLSLSFFPHETVSSFYFLRLCFGSPGLEIRLSSLCYTVWPWVSYFAFLNIWICHLHNEDKYYVI